jgi:alpha-tubulin suppressor-like RCC1 family protein
MLLVYVMYSTHRNNSNGAPWACGRGEYGRLGLGSESSKRVLEMLPMWKQHSSGSSSGTAMSRVIDVSLGGTHSLLLTEGES